MRGSGAEGDDGRVPGRAAPCLLDEKEALHATGGDKRLGREETGHHRPVERDGTEFLDLEKDCFHWTMAKPSSLRTA